MKNYVIVNNVKAKALNLNLTEAYILGYLHKFMQSGNMKFLDVGHERYYFITYNKILSDLPILGIELRTLKDVFKGFFQKGLLKKYDKTPNKLYITFDGSPYNKDFEYEFTSKKAPTMAEIREKYPPIYARSHSKPNYRKPKSMYNNAQRNITFEEARRLIADIFDGKFRKNN